MTTGKPRAHIDESAPARIFALGDGACELISVAGAKAAWLRKALDAGLPVLSGLVVPAVFSRRHLDMGAAALPERGSGGARLVVSEEPLEDGLATELVAGAALLGDRVVVRSSSVLEGDGRWSGAFTSYLDVLPPEVPRAVAGCWASAFSVAALGRFEAAGLQPAAAPMAVVVQAALEPELGGTARLEGEDVVVVAVAGSPASLVQGWEPGEVARVPPASPPHGDGAVELVGEDRLAEVAAILRAARSATGATACEWAMADGRLWILQLAAPPVSQSRATLAAVPELADPAAIDVARLARRFPGPLGEAFVLPWAVSSPASFLETVPPGAHDPREAYFRAAEVSATLTAQVWGLPKTRAGQVAAMFLRDLRGPAPGAALSQMAALRRPDADLAHLVLELLATVLDRLVTIGAVTWPETAWHLTPDAVGSLLASPGPVAKRPRIGFDRWEPFSASVLAATGRTTSGISAAPGIAAGRLCNISHPSQAGLFRPRDVIVASHPTPDLAPLLWDAAGIVTTGGSPAAHLFESARALAIPAVCGVPLEEAAGGPVASAHGTMAIAVDGIMGTVALAAW